MDKDDSREPFIILKNVDALNNYYVATTNEVFIKDFLKAHEYIKLRRRYPARFPADFFKIYDLSLWHYLLVRGITPFWPCKVFVVRRTEDVATSVKRIQRSLLIII